MLASLFVGGGPNNSICLKMFLLVVCVEIENLSQPLLKTASGTDLIFVHGSFIVSNKKM